MIAYSTEERNNDLDEFLTPSGLIVRVSQLLDRHAFSKQPFTVLDPGANRGQWGTAIKGLFPYASVTGVEIMDAPKPDAYDHWYANQDYLTWKTDQRYDLIIGNPPYSTRLNGKKKVVAEKFIRKSIGLLKPRGWLYFVLRSGIRHSRERLWKDRQKRTQPGLHQELHFFESWALSPRPSFYKEDTRTKQYGTSNTNAHEYDLFTWTVQWQMPFGFSLELDWEYTYEKDVRSLYPLCTGHIQHLQTVGLEHGSAQSRA